MATTLDHVDVLNRRLRYAQPQPRPNDHSIRLGERDFLIFEKIARHHHLLPSNYLFEFTKQLNPNLSRFRLRLTKLYNGTIGGIRYLAKPVQQKVSEYAREQPLIYELQPAAAIALEERGRTPRYPHSKSDPFVHRLMSACRSASFDLALSRMGHRFLSLDEIFAHKRCPDTTRQSAYPLALPLQGFDRQSLVPDDLFGICYSGGQKPLYRFFAVEDDRKTESIDSGRYQENAYGRKIRGYLDIIRNHTYKSFWGIPNLRVLTLTTNTTHMHNQRKFVASIAEPELAERFLFRVKPESGTSWQVPPIMYDLFEEPWLSATGAPYSLSKI